MPATPPPADSPSILVIGAGELGASVLSALTRHVAGHPGAAKIAVLLRPPADADAKGDARSKELTEAGVTIEHADVATASVAELAAIMGRHHTVISCVGFAAGPGTQRKLAQSALTAGVSRFFPWQFGVDYDEIGRGSAQALFDEQLDVRDLLRNQDTTEWVIVSTGMFTSFLFEPEFGVVDLPADTVRALGSWDNRVTLTTPEDIGALTADIVFAEPRIRDTVVYLAGDTISYRELADIVDRVRATSVTRTLWTTDFLADQLRQRPADTMSKYRAVFARTNGVAWPKDQSYNAVRGINTTTAEEWARANLV
ncbi:aromatic alcohol reductase [Mycolicibacterium neworleansense]|uniref:Isoflavone reductase n=1 Tax=Mycolicibacterium neworleansense TaxID=146018 RepID=A0A0H5RRY8_9MYCO|nr:aromatic alcohol reductase [Mycolicibacterium neworleansense]MCV7361557.1 aromatic alcohol reductase [Mycolicibacterium neworleansense]CRZ16910.1 isoflavone reductase [Mycolicibacterium neworleansense]